MTLDEAIEHVKEVAMTCDDKACAAEHAQLAEWLSLLKVYTDTHMAEEVQRARHEMHGWQLEWKREMERRKELEIESAKLRELVNDMWTCISHGSEGWDCTGCRRDPDSVCIRGISEFSQRMRELGIEAGE